MGTIPEKYELHVMTKVVQNIFLERKISKSFKKPEKCHIPDYDKGFGERKLVCARLSYNRFFNFGVLSKKNIKNFFYDMSFFVFVQITTVTLKDERDWYRDQT